MSSESTVDQRADRLGRRTAEDGHQRDAKPRADAFGADSLFTALIEHSIGNLEALLKASDIFARGFKMMNTAVVGSTCMAIDDAMADTRTALSCRSWQQMVEIETEAALLGLQRYLGRASVLCRMATQLVQDALFPLERRIGVAFDVFGREAH